MKSKQRDEERIMELLDLGASKVDIWRYYSDRADAFASQLWSTGTWLFAVMTAVLTLPFLTGFIKPDTPHMFQFTSRPLTVAIYCFGLLLCSYSYVVLSDIREHIERNWERADLARTGQWLKAHWGGRKLAWLVDPAGIRRSIRIGISRPYYDGTRLVVITPSWPNIT